MYAWKRTRRSRPNTKLRGCSVNTSDKANQLQALRDRYVPKGHPVATPFFVESANGALLRDVDGREFIDFVGGIGVLNVGHRNDRVVAAIKDQADK